MHACLVDSGLETELVALAVAEAFPGPRVGEEADEGSGVVIAAGSSACREGMRPNSAAQTTRVCSSMPLRFRSAISAVVGWSMISAWIECLPEDAMVAHGFFCRRNLSLSEGVAAGC